MVTFFDILLYIFTVFVCNIPDFSRLPFMVKGISRFRARVVGLGPNREIGKGVTIKQGFRFPRTLHMKVGEGTKINDHVSIGAGERFKIGKNSLILSQTSIDCTGGVVIGSATQIGRNNEIYSHKHQVTKKDVSVLEAAEELAPVRIGDDVMFFSNVKLMPGVQVENGVVALNSALLSKNCEAYGIYGGVPAKKVSERS